MKYSSIFSMLSFFILFACNETAVYGSDENIIFMRYVEKLHLDKYSVKNTVKTETMAIQLGKVRISHQTQKNAYVSD
ncbi:TPA: hypothetical protein HL451_19960 [Escherichia coli]|nr:hypothetical protein [Escherichia coli]